jgi:hypothetical protein
MSFGSRMLTGVLRDAAGEGGGDGAETHSLEQRISQLRSEIQKERNERLATAAKAKEATIREALGKFEYARPRGAEIAYRSVRDQIQVIDGELYGPDYSPLDTYLETLFSEDLSMLLSPNAGGSKEAGGSTIAMGDIRPGSPKLEAARVEIAKLVAQQFAPAGAGTRATSKGTSTGMEVNLDDIRPGGSKLEAARTEIARLASEMVKAPGR